MDDLSNVFDKVQEVDLQETMEQSYIEYAMSVIASRALAGCKRWVKTCTETYIVCND